jgi:hypothetical protein
MDNNNGWVKQSEWHGNPALGFDCWLKYFKYKNRKIPVYLFGKEGRGKNRIIWGRDKDDNPVPSGKTYDAPDWQYVVSAGANSDLSHSGGFYPLTPSLEQAMAIIDQRHGDGRLIYAKGGSVVKKISEDNKYRYVDSYSNKYDGVFAGNFELKNWHNTAYLYALDDFDKKYVSGVPLGVNERIYRYETEVTKVGKMTPLIKVNIESGLVYFLTNDASEKDYVEFEKRGTKVRFLNIVPEVSSDPKIGLYDLVRAKNLGKDGMVISKHSEGKWWVRLDGLTYDEIISEKDLIVRKGNDSRLFAKGGEIKQLVSSGGMDAVTYNELLKDAIDSGDVALQNQLEYSNRLAKHTALENILKDKINEKGGGQVKAKILTKAGNSSIERFALASGRENVIVMMKGKKRFGKLLASIIDDIDDVTGIQFYEESSTSYADDLENKQKYILKNIHPNLWSDLKSDYLFSAEKLQRFRVASRGLDHFESWKLAGEQGLPKIEQHKTITMQSAGMPEYAQRSLAKAIDEKQDYRYSWVYGYDCSVETKMSEDGIYRGWFSQEFKGTGNGYYWLLISPTQAIFAERD